MSLGSRSAGTRDPVPIALRASAVLGEGLRAAFANRRFEVLESKPSVQLAQEHPGLLMVCEVQEDTELLARELLEQAPESPLVFIGPTGSDAATRPNVRELSADVSVAEVVRVCELIAFGDTSSEQWITPVSQPSLPYNVLPRVSDPAMLVPSVPAPLMPSSVPPNSSRPNPGRRPTIAPGLEGAFGDDPSANLAREVSADLSRLLADAETRVARAFLPRRNPGESAAPEPVLALSPEVLAALEDPIGDYDLSPVPSEKAEPLPPPLSMRGITDVMASRQATGDVPAEPPPSPLPTQAPTIRPTGSPSPVPPSMPSSASAAAHRPSPASDSHPHSNPQPSEPTTAPPPRTNDDRVTVRPTRQLSPIPPAPALPKGSWLNAAVAAEPPNNWRQNLPTSPLPVDPPSEEPRHLAAAADPTTIEPPTHQPPADVPVHLQRDLPPLKRGDAISLLATAVRSHFTGALAFEAEGGVRRVVLRDGDFSTAASGLRGESLLAFLVGRGSLSPEVEAQLGHKVPSLGRHAGAALVAAGHLAQDQLWNVLRAHAEFLIGRIALIESGMAGFEEEVPARLRAEPAVFGGATGSEILIETLRRVIEPADALQRLGGQDTQLTRGDQFDLLDECALAADERSLLEGLLELPLGEALANAPHAEVPCVLYALTQLHILQAAPLRPKRAPAHSPAARDRLDDQALRKAILARKALIENGDYFAVLGVARQATGYDIKSAYLNLRRQFDPSHVLTPATLDLRDDIDLVLEVVAEAYAILSDQLQRDRYRRAIESQPY